jgi:hypothetical protein
MIPEVFGKGLSLGIAALLIGSLIVGCEDDSQVLTERPAPPPPAANKEAIAPEKVAKPAEIETKVKAAPEKVENKAEAKEQKDSAQANAEPSDAATAKPLTLVPGDNQVCGVADGAHLSQELDFAWRDKNEKVRVEITEPKANAVIRSGRVRVQVRLVGFETQMGEDGRGNHLRVLLDNETPRDWFSSSERTMVIEGLATGLHTIRVFAATAWGESIKAPKAYDAVNFYIKSNKDQPIPVDFSKPVLSYSKPEGVYSGRAAERILLDFHLANARLTVGGNNVRLTLDGGAPIDLAAWSPVWLEAVPKGTHSVSLTLVGPDGKALHGPYNEVERSFTVE